MVKLGNVKVPKGVIANVTRFCHEAQFNPIENNPKEGHQTFGNINVSTTIEIVDNISNLGTMLILLHIFLWSMHVGMFYFQFCFCCYRSMWLLFSLYYVLYKINKLPQKDVMWVKLRSNYKGCCLHIWDWSPMSLVRI